jgi:hypothetical protein
MLKPDAPRPVRKGVSLPAILASCLALASLAAQFVANAASEPGSAPLRGASPSITNAASLAMVVPQSVFTIPTSAKEGRNPFFPSSKYGLQITSPKEKESPADAAVALVLNGITSPPRRLAMINGRTFEANEMGEVPTAAGRVRIRCLEIMDDHALIQVGGERLTLYLRRGL